MSSRTKDAFLASDEAVASFDWHQFGSLKKADRWEVVRGSNGDGWALAYVLGDGSSVTAILIDHHRFSEILAAIPVVGGGRSYILGPQGDTVISPPGNGLNDAKFDQIVPKAGKIIASRPSDRKNVVENVEISDDGESYAIATSPLWFNGWQLVVVAPEKQFLDGVGRIYRTLPLIVAALVLAAVTATLVLNNLIFRRPFEAIIENLRRIERFEFNLVTHHPSSLLELDRISDAIARMSKGLGDFAKFIPVDQVRSILAARSGVTSGGTRRFVTVLFSDIVGFTYLSEQLGEDVIPLLSRYFEVTSAEIARQAGTIDKYIGDSVMAFWGSQAASSDQVFLACTAALEVVSKVQAIELAPDRNGFLKIRIGIDCGVAVVGYVGSDARLSYTAIGDVVNLSSRIENVNKTYGTSILLGESAVALAGDRIITREIDRVLVHGCSSPLCVHELLGIQGRDGLPKWAETYGKGLEDYRSRQFADAIKWFDQVLFERPEDGAALFMRGKCRNLLADPPEAEWRPVTTIFYK